MQISYHSALKHPISIIHVFPTQALNHKAGVKGEGASSEENSHVSIVVFC